MDNQCCGNGLCDKHGALFQPNVPHPDWERTCSALGWWLAHEGYGPSSVLPTADERYAVLDGWKAYHAHNR